MSRKHKHRTRTLAEIFSAPLLLGALTLVGLFAAPFGQGEAWTWLAWATLSVPVAVAAWFSCRRPADA